MSLLGSVGSIGSVLSNEISAEQRTSAAQSFGLLLTDILDCGSPICSWEELHFEKFLGHGTSMEVSAGKWGPTPVAIKRMKVENQAQGQSSIEADERGIRRQLKATSLELRTMSHSMVRKSLNVVKLLAVSWREEGPEWHRVLRPALVMELAHDFHPTLEHLAGHLTHKDLGYKAELLCDILNGLVVIHECSIVLGDLKPENVLLFENPGYPHRLTAKLSDFGFSQGDPDSELSAGGTPYWNAPECLDGCSGSLAAWKLKRPRDIYSFGLIAIYLLKGEKPFGSDSSEDWPTKEIEVSSSKLGDKLTEQVRDILRDSMGLKSADPAEPTLHLAMTNQDELRNSVELINSKLGAGQLKYVTYNHETNQWEEADGWITVGTIGLHLATSLEPSSRPSAQQLLHFWGFASPNAKDESFTPTPGMPVIGWKTGANRTQEDGLSFDYNRVPAHMRASLFRQMKIEAEKKHGHVVLKSLVADWYIMGFGVARDMQLASEWIIKAAQTDTITARSKMLLSSHCLIIHYRTLFLPLPQPLEREFLLNCICYGEEVAIHPTDNELFLNFSTHLALVRTVIANSGISLSHLKWLLLKSRPTIVNETEDDAPAADRFSYVQLKELAMATEKSQELVQDAQDLPLQDSYALALVCCKEKLFLSLQFLVQHNPNILSALSLKRYTLLQVELLRSDFESIAALCRFGADPSSLFEPAFVRWVAFSGTELMLAVLLRVHLLVDKLGHKYGLKAAVDDVTTLELQTGLSSVPVLHGCVILALSRNMITLMQVHPNLELSYGNGITPLWMAVILRRPVFVVSLAIFGANANARLVGQGYSITPLLLACAAGAKGVKIVEEIELCREQIERTPQPPEESVPEDLVQASAPDAAEPDTRLQICKALLGAGHADVNVRDGDGMTPLLWCCQQGLLDCAALLVAERKPTTGGAAADEGANSDAVDFRAIDRRGFSALHFAALAGSVALVRFCLHHEQALAHLRTENGETAWDLARERDHMAVCDVLATAGEGGGKKTSSS